MVQPTRIVPLNAKSITHGKFILYWMQQSQRAEYNYALQYAIESANKLNLPVLVFFGLTATFPDANWRHYFFMVEGLRETASNLKLRGIQMVIVFTQPYLGIIELARDAAIVIVDKGYLRIQRQWRQKVSSAVECLMLEVESDVIVPVTQASSKEEFSAATLRPKILAKLNDYLISFKTDEVKKDSLNFNFRSVDLSDPVQVLKSLNVDSAVREINWLRGGSSFANELLFTFIKFKLDHYPAFRNDPSMDSISNLSPYLHFGQISPLQVALEIQRSGSPGVSAFLEELILRRELSMNFIWYNNHYDSIKGLPAWALKTLNEHRLDKRHFTYSLQEFELGKTHDPYWNAAQNEMVYRGKMHGYMRMYWGKKILEWSATPEDAFRIALYLNNKYEIDGRDANGFTGVAWCFGKHDRAWKERSIFGKVRFMNAEGLKRKFAIDNYVQKINQEIRDRTSYPGAPKGVP